MSRPADLQPDLADSLLSHDEAYPTINTRSSRRASTLYETDGMRYPFTPPQDLSRMSSEYGMRNSEGVVPTMPDRSTRSSLSPYGSPGQAGTTPQGQPLLGVQSPPASTSATTLNTGSAPSYESAAAAYKLEAGRAYALSNSMSFLMC